MLFRIQKEMAQVKMQYANANYLPSINGTARNTYNAGLFIDPSTNLLSSFNSQVYALALTADWTLLNGGYNYYYTRQQEALLQSADYKLNWQERQAGLTVFPLVYSILQAEIQSNYIAQQLDYQQKLLAQLEKQVAEGVRPKRDLVSQEAELALLKARQKQLDLLVAKQLLELRWWAGVDAQTILLLPAVESLEKTPLFSLSFPSDTQAKSFPLLNGLQSDISASEWYIKQLQALRYPSLSLSGGLVTRSSSLIQLELSDQFNRNLSKYISFSLNVPVFNRFQTTQQIKLAQLNKAYLMQTSYKQARNFQLQMLQNKIDFEGEKAIYQALKAQEEALNTQLVFDQKQFLLGLIPFNQYRQSMMALYDNKAQQFQSLAKCWALYSQTKYLSTGEVVLPKF